MDNRNIIFRDGTGRDGTGRDGTGRGGIGEIFHTIASVANLFSAWNEFKQGKRKKKDIALFELCLEDNIFALHEALVSKKYAHDPYEAFYVCDPKRRHIHKASVRDRVLHQAIFRDLYPLFDKHFIYDSYSSRLGKGTHAGVARLEKACRKVTKNWKVSAYTLKCDVRKFFDSIDHVILRRLIVKKISDPDLLWLIDLIFASFEKEKGKGLPLGNVTSQLFANVYLNEFDQFAKHALKATYYFRYCDDFVIVRRDRCMLEGDIESIRKFLKEQLSLDLHPHKVEIRKVRQGTDFLGYVTLPYTRIVRTKTKNRIVRKITEGCEKIQNGKISKDTFNGMIASCRGITMHARSRRLRSHIDRHSDL
jgi:RNA-directed DNA polymerase